MKKLLIASTMTLSIAIASLVSGVASAAYYNLVGQATLISPGANGSNTAVSLRSDFTSTDPALNVSFIQFDVPEGLTFGELSTLSVDYNVTDDDCVPDSPRFHHGSR